MRPFNMSLSTTSLATLNNNNVIFLKKRHATTSFAKQQKRQQQQQQQQNSGYNNNSVVIQKTNLAKNTIHGQEQHLPDEQDEKHNAPTNNNNAHDNIAEMQSFISELGIIVQQDRFIHMGDLKLIWARFRVANIRGLDYFFENLQAKDGKLMRKQRFKLADFIRCLKNNQSNIINIKAHFGTMCTQCTRLRNTKLFQEMNKDVFCKCVTTQAVKPSTYRKQILVGCTFQK